MKRLLRSVLILAVLTFLPVSWIGAVEGQVVFTLGEVLVIRDSEELEADIGMAVGEGDVIVTGPEGMAVISVEDNSEIKLRESTSLSLDTLGEEIAISLSSGGVFSRVADRLTRNYTIRTENAVAGVRGTEFFVAYGRTIDPSPDIWMCVNSGSIEVSILSTNETIVLEESFGINLVGGETITKPRRYPWVRRLNWNMDAVQGEVVDRTDLERAYSDLLDQDYD
jgi:ferric-dicitrate binding protein FerR (iron transport regulator)